MAYKCQGKVWCLQRVQHSEMLNSVIENNNPSFQRNPSIKRDMGQHLQFLQCFFLIIIKIIKIRVSTKHLLILQYCHIAQFKLNIIPPLMFYYVKVGLQHKTQAERRKRYKFVSIPTLTKWCNHWDGI